MEVKITVKQKPIEIDWKTLPLGTVVEFENKEKAIVYRQMTNDSDQSALLLLGEGVEYQQALGFLAKPVVKIVGRISEIIVEGK